MVAVVDSGIMVEHSRSRKISLWKGPHSDRKGWTHGARCIGGTLSPDIADQNGHGTRLAGHDPRRSSRRRASGVQLMAVKFFDPTRFPGRTMARPRSTSRQPPEPSVDIINLSWDLGMGSSKLEEAINNACKGSGILVVIAAGNSGADNAAAHESRNSRARDRELCPEQIITVMATDLYNEKGIVLELRRQDGGPGRAGRGDSRHPRVDVYRLRG